MHKRIRMIAWSFAIGGVSVLASVTEADAFELLDRMVSVSQKGAVQKGGKCQGSCQKGGHGALQKGGHGAHQKGALHKGGLGAHQKGALQKGGHGALQKGALHKGGHGAHQKGAAQKGKGHVRCSLFSRSHGKGKGKGHAGGKLDLDSSFKSDVVDGNVTAPTPPPLPDVPSV